MRVAVRLPDRVAVLCAGCDAAAAFVVCSDDPSPAVWYGLCAVCGHTVWLGALGVDWAPGAPAEYPVAEDTP